MINPCKECLVAPTCTYVCDKKLNSKTIIRNAYEQHRDYKWKNPRNLNVNQMYVKWRDRLWEVNKDISKIRIRRMNLQNPDGIK